MQKQPLRPRFGSAAARKTDDRSPIREHPIDPASLVNDALRETL
jgi:hypothetical protein